MCEDVHVSLCIYYQRATDWSRNSHSVYEAAEPSPQDFQTKSDILVIVCSLSEKVWSSPGY